MTGYLNGMLMVCLNKSYGVGLTYLNEEKYNRNKTVCVSTTKNPKSEFSKILLSWCAFVIHLETVISQGTIITPEVFKNSMTATSYLEYESIQRFKLLCNKYGWCFERNTNTASVTDVFVDGFKIQMKYTNQFVVTTGRNRVSLPKTGYKNNKKSLVSYSKNDNDYYIIELGSHLGEFLILSEQLLIEKGFISVDNQKALMDLTCYKQYCVDDKLLTKNKHWTQHWISINTLNDELGDIKLTDFL